MLAQETIHQDQLQRLADIVELLLAHERVLGAMGVVELANAAYRDCWVGVDDAVYPSRVQAVGVAHEHEASKIEGELVAWQVSHRAVITVLEDKPWQLTQLIARCGHSGTTMPPAMPVPGEPEGGSNEA